MKVTTKGRYGLRAMIELAVNHGTGPVAIGAIAQRQAISLKYLHAILSTLKKAHLVKSLRGRSGGYMLARDPVRITLREIIRALEGPMALVECVKDKGSCPRSSICTTHQVWTDLSADIDRLLEQTTLEELACRGGAKKTARQTVTV